MMEATHDHDNGTTDSVGGSTPNTIDVEFGDDAVHDQLPSVEEYKSNLPRGSSISMNKKQISGGGDQDDENIHDQLPSVEDAMASGALAKPNGGSLHYLCMALGLIVITLIIVIPLVLIDKESEVQALSPTALARRDQAIQHLVDLGISSEGDLSTPGTPQSRAVNWLAAEDSYAIDIPTIMNKHTRFVERYVLAVFYYSTNGQFWANDVRFLQPIDHCQWYADFITLAGDIVRYGITGCVDVDTSENMGGGQLTTEIVLPQSALIGGIPSEIQYLNRLEVLKLPFNNGLTGPFPVGLEKLVRLSTLELQYNKMTGTIPEWIDNLRSLTWLALGNNALGGALPSNFYRLTNLEFLGLDDNSLSGKVEDFGTMTQLRFLYLEDNEFTGDISDLLLASWSQIEELDLSSNKIDSTLPSNLFSLEKLVVVDLHDNSFRGSIPEVPSQNDALNFVALYQNDLTSTIPSSISLLPNLLHLDVSKNQLISPLPAELGDFNKLRYLFVGDNQLSKSPFPEFLSKLKTMRELSLKNSKLTGSIPASIGDLLLLQVLDLDGNELSGTIPDDLGNPRGLDHLLLNGNKLEGSIPTTFSKLTDLDVILLDGNSLNGTAEVLCNDEKIELLHFSADCLEPNPEIECECCNLCCEDTNTTCNALDWNINLDPIWEYGYTRRVYVFSPDEVNPAD